MIRKIKKSLYLEKPVALQHHEWEAWHENTRRERPAAYFFRVTLPDWFEDIYKNITKPFNDLRYAIRVRVFDRYHVIHTGLEPGYADCDTRMLHGMFNLLVDFVEVEQAWMHVAFDEAAQKKYSHPWWSLGWTRFRAFRDPEAGLAYLRWEMTLDDPALKEHERSPSQAQTAREVWELYHWWKEVRPNRPDPHDASGWSEYCDARRAIGRSPLDFRYVDEEDQQRRRTALDRTHEIEQAYDREDDEMLMRLIKIRKSLWT